MVKILNSNMLYATRHFYPTAHSETLCCSLKLAVVKVFIPWKLTNTINQSFSNLRAHTFTRTITP